MFSHGSGSRTNDLGIDIADLRNLLNWIILEPLFEGVESECPVLNEIMIVQILIDNDA